MCFSEDHAGVFSGTIAGPGGSHASINALLAAMTLEEKIGQLNMVATADRRDWAGAAAA